jgi:phytanoyl-CoA dioxygenase PhyH
MNPSQTESGAQRQSMTTDPKAFYEEKGYLGPLRAFDAEELERIGVVSLIESWDKREPARSRNRHLDTPQIAKICQNERIRSIVQKVLGQEDLVLWRTNIFAVESRAHGFSWHQDDYRTLLECPSAGAHCSVQLNFTDSTPTNSVSIIPGTHHFSEEDFRKGGYAMVPGSDSDEYGTPYWGIPPRVEMVDILLKAGEFYVFHSRLLHASLQGRRLSSMMVRNRIAGRWGGIRNRLHSKLTHENVIRYSIAMRIATANIQILPAAFVQSPSRNGVVLFSGRDPGTVNRLRPWT